MSKWIWDGHYSSQGNQATTNRKESNLCAQSEAVLLVRDKSVTYILDVSKSTFICAITY